MSNSLVEVPIDYLQSLRDSYKVNWPDHIMAFNFLHKMIERFEKFPEHREIIKIYSIDGKIEEDATFIAITHDKEIVFATLDLTFERLNIGLNCLEFKTEKMFMCFRAVYRNAILKFIKHKNLNILYDDRTTMVYMKKEDASLLQYEVPEGLVVRSLSISDADKVNSVWPYKAPGTDKFMSYKIEFNFSAGLYDEKSGELLAWVLEHDNTSLLALQVDADHFRKGYGLIVAKALTKKIAQERGLDVHTNIIHYNTKSMSLFEKLSFRKIDTNFWIGAINK